jgi:hypothetical protein
MQSNGQWQGTSAFFTSKNDSMTEPVMPQHSGEVVFSVLKADNVVEKHGMDEVKSKK